MVDFNKYWNGERWVESTWWQTNVTTANNSTLTFQPQVITGGGQLFGGIPSDTIISLDDMAQQALRDAWAMKQYEPYGRKETVKMPKWGVFNEVGSIISWEDDEDTARRKAKAWASNNKAEAFVLKPVCRCEPKDVPVETVELK